MIVNTDQSVENTNENNVIKDSCTSNANIFILGDHGGMFQEWSKAYEKAILTPLILDQNTDINNTEPICFMTDDNPSKAQNTSTALDINFDPVTQSSNVETTIVELPTDDTPVEPSPKKYNQDSSVFSFTMGFLRRKQTFFN